MVAADRSRVAPWLAGLMLAGLALLSACTSANAHVPRATAYQSVTVVGDSLSILGRDSIWSTLGDAGWTANIAAFPGRTTTDQMSALQEAAERPQAATVIELGTNDALAMARDGVTVAQETAIIDRALAQFSDRRCLVWVNVDRDPERQGADDGTQIDAILRNEVARHPNLHIADMEAVLARHPEYLVADHVHFTAAGYHALASLMAGGLADCRHPIS
jgi:lysophospholipase L1-like esterase